MADRVRKVKKSAGEKTHRKWLPTPMVWLLTPDLPPTTAELAYTAAEDLLYGDIRPRMDHVWRGLVGRQVSGMLSIKIVTTFAKGPIPSGILSQVLKELDSKATELLRHNRHDVAWKHVSDSGLFECRLAWDQLPVAGLQSTVEPKVEAEPSIRTSERSGAPPKSLAQGDETVQVDDDVSPQPRPPQMSPIDEDFESQLKAVSEEGPKGFVAQAKRFAALGHRFRKTIAELLQGSLNEHVQSLPQETPKEKQSIAVWVNAQLRELGLAIRCPKTGRPSVMISDIKESGSEVGRFRLENRDDQGAKVRSWTSTTLPELELMEDVPRKEPLLDWSKRAGKKDPPRRG